MASGPELARAKVTIEADLAKYDASMRQVQTNTSKRILELNRKIQAEMARVKIDLNVAREKGNFRDIDRLNNSLETLRARLSNVNKAMMNQASRVREYGMAAAAIEGRTGGGGRRTGTLPGGGGFGGHGGGNKAVMGSMALMQLGSALDDVQYGFRGVLNNIPMMVSGFSAMLGASTALSIGLGGVAAILATVVYQLYNNWSKLMDLMGMGKVKTEAEEMQKLAEATRRTAEEEEKLRKYREREAKKKELFGGVGGAPTQAEHERKEAASDVIKRAGGDELAGAIVAAKEKEGTLNLSEAGKKRVKDAANARLREEAKARGLRSNDLKLINGGVIAKQIFQEEKLKVMREEAAARAKTLLAKAATGDTDAIKQIEAMRARNPALFKTLGPGDLTNVMPGKFETSTQKGIKEHNNQIEEESQKLNEERAEKIANEFLQGGGRKKLLEQPGADVSAGVRGRLAQAGYDQNTIKALAPLIIAAMHKAVEQEIGKRSLNEGVTREQARTNLLTETKEKEELRLEGAKDRVKQSEQHRDDLRQRIDDFRREHNKPTFMGISEYGKKLAVGGFDADKYQKEIAKLQREEVDATKNVEKAIKELDLVARAIR